MYVVDYRRLLRREVRTWETRPFAEGIGIENLADPRETRHYLCSFLGASLPRLGVSLGPKPHLGAPL